MEIIEVGAAGRAVVVEDDEGIRTLLAQLLGVRGWQVDTAADGESGLELVRSTAPDVVLLDLGLSDIDGLEVLRRLKLDPELAAIPVVVVTAWDDGDVTSRAIDAGAHDYVRKPFDIDEIASRVAAAARTKAAHDRLQAANAELQRLAADDDLTGVANRRSLDDALAREIARARRGTRALSVLMLDIDHLKSVNDAHGHAVGDEVLRGVAQILTYRARVTDVVGRWGGDEFLVVVTDTDRTGAAILAEELRGAVETAEFAGARTTVSIGCASWAAGDEDRATLMQRCDRALYQAKTAGRNAVASAAAARGHLRIVA